LPDSFSYEGCHDAGQTILRPEARPDELPHRLNRCRDRRVLLDIAVRVDDDLSKHLQLLHALDFVVRWKEGLFVYYRLSDEHVFQLCDIMCGRIGGGGEWIMRGTHKGDLPGMPATGRRVEVRGASIFEFAGNRIRRCSDYWDMATFLKQLGLMPP
jgi:hypothetical protein